MHKTLLSTLTCALLCTIGYAQNNFGARLNAMGENSVAVTDIWNVNGNAAGIIGVKTTSAALNYTKYLFDSELNQQAVALVMPLNKNYIGFSAQRYGFSAYNELNAGFTFARKFGEQFGIGVKINYHQLRITNYGSVGSFSVNVGGVYNLTEQLTVGLYLTNPSQQNYTVTTVLVKIPSAVYAGAAYQLSNKLLIASTLKKDFDQKIDVGLGIDYNILESFSLRGGITAKPFKQYVGFGFNYKNLLVDFATEKDPNLGYIPQIAVGYAF